MAPERFGIRLSHNARLGQLLQCPAHPRIRDSRAHLERLDEKFRLDNTARARFKIEFVGRAAVAPDPFEHGVDLTEQVRALPCDSPDAAGELHKFTLKRAGDRAGTGQSLRFPELPARLVV